jgi:putative tricarboxylic transport membrane protein
MNARKEISGGLVLLLLGIGYLAYNTQYPMDTWSNPGPAVFPLIVGGVFILLALAHLVQGVRQGGWGDSGESSGSRTGFFRSVLQGCRESKAFTLIVIFILYLFLMKGVGFYLSSLLFVGVSSRLIGAKDWTKPLALAVGIDLFCYLLFEAWLKVSLPKGLLF